MPEDAPALKVAATAGYGAHIIRYNRYTEDREQIGRQLAAEHGFALIPPYDHPDVIAGQGTSAKELLEEVGQLDALFVPLGGGGLLSGSALAARSLSPGCKILGLNLKLVTMDNNPSDRVPLFISIRQKLSQMALKHNTSMSTHLPLFAKMSMIF